MTIFSWLKRQWRHPTFSTLLEHRKTVLIYLVIIVVYIVLAATGFGFWSCPIKKTLGIQCPGCGLSHAIVDLLQGEWGLALKEHGFAPLFIAGFLFTAVMVLLPVSLYRKVNHRIRLLEGKTGFFNVIMAALVVYWIVRMFIRT